MTYPVKWFSSHGPDGNPVPGAPVLSGTPGSLITVLDACRTGYGTVSVASLVVSSGVATATVSAGHGLLDQQIALIAGATQSALNGEQRITRISATQFSYPTSAADGTAAGAITVKVAPVGGWEKSFGGTNLAAYRSTDETSQRRYLRVDDTGADQVPVQVYDAMNGIDAGSGPLLTGGAVSNWRKGVGGPWIAVADERAVYVSLRSDNANQIDALQCYAELADTVPGDAWSDVLVGWTANPVSSFSHIPDWRLGNSSGHWLRASRDGATPTLAWTLAGSSLSGGPGLDSSGVAYPQPGAGVLASPLWVIDSGGLYRGRLPGLWQLLHPRASLPAPLTIISGPDGRKLLICRATSNNGNTPRCAPAFDITGPWR